MTREGGRTASELEGVGVLVEADPAEVDAGASLTDWRFSSLSFSFSKKGLFILFSMRELARLNVL